MVGKWSFHHGPLRAPPGAYVAPAVMDLVVDTASLAPTAASAAAPSSDLLSFALVLSQILMLLLDLQEPVWLVLCHGVGSAVAAPLDVCSVGFDTQCQLVVASRHDTR